MSGNNRPLNRRTVLKTLGIGAASLTTTAGTTIGAKGSIPHQSLRGTVNNPVKIGQIAALRKRFSKKHSSKEEREQAFLGAGEAFGDDQVLAYNVVVGADGTPREQYVTRGGSSATMPERAENPRAVTNRLHKKADELLAQVTTDQTASTDGVTTQGSYDIDWANWNKYGSTDVYHEFAPDPEYDTRPGAVKFVNEVRRSPDDPRMGARSKVRMEPGRQLCNDGFDEYCTPTVQTGWTNRSATVNIDWDQYVNETATEELIVGTDPAGQISDVNTTRTASIGLELSRDPSLSVGYSSSVTLPGAELVDKTSLKSGRSEHEFSVNTPSSNSSKNNAIFEVGSAATYQTTCGSFNKSRIVDISVDLAWGLDSPIGGWANKTTNNKTFYYYTYC
ncbi:hypothetical protein [Halorussus lipolyticus]|uniref:hypothetical protein n=1 Tax=Halorussus lipolyticus TaxID=3034024 RepID=UPI0023E7DF05|nr:hypothetical protein [Halorussus sp. DT80]